MPYNYQRKMACSYGWDWGPVTISSGIWKKVELIKWDTAYLSSVSVLPSIEEQISTLTVRPNIVGIREGHKVQIQVLDGESVIAVEVISAKLDSHTFEVPSAQLWQPRGRGEQKLYTVETQLIYDNKILQSETKRVGFRTVELDTSAINSQDMPDKHMFAIKVNGLHLWIKGVNWIPDDPFPTRVTRERYEARIKDMLDANINAIRVWGGGIYESEDFYNLCDQEGIVVWQDFLFACAAYPETPEMLEEVELEAKEVVLRLESHPSLVMWCGGNECIEGFQHWGWKETLAGRPWGETFYLETLDKVVKELDGTRPYIPGSPFSTHSDDVNSFDSGTNHIWDVWNELGYERYEQYKPSFAAEFGFNGPGSWSMLTRAIGKETLDSNDKDVETHLKALKGISKIADNLAREFTLPPTQGVPWYFASTLVQARAVEVGLKHFRSLKEVCSGTILWQFNDMWPAISWSVVDYTGFRKLAWHAMKSAYQPRTIAIGRVDQGAQLALINEASEEWISTVQISLVDASGNMASQSNLNFTVNAFDTKSFKLVDMFPQISGLEFEGFLHLEAGDFKAARRSTLRPAKLAPKQMLTYSTKIESGALSVEVVAVNYLHELCLLSEVIDTGTQVDSQLISLLPGDSHTFVVTGQLETLRKVESQIESLLWSHNRLVNP
jgi:beta-mannosidase